MIADFIKVNKINAKVFSFATDMSFEKVASIAHVSPKSIAKVTPFVSEKERMFVYISLAEEKILPKEVEKVFGLVLHDVDKTQCLKLSGFEREFFPPIGIFGVQTEISENAEHMGALVFMLSHREFVLIEGKELRKAVDLGNELGFF